MGDVAYQNKDIASKVTSESLVGKSLAPFGLPDLKVVEILPTNLPEIEANELRLDNLFVLEDGSIGILDYESEFTKENFVKYINYVARVIKRYAKQKRLADVKKIIILVIYTADVEWAEDIYDLGGLILRVEAAYLVKQDTNAIYQRPDYKIHAGERLTEEEMAQLMILPLTVKGKTGKQYYIEKAIWLARQMRDGEQSVRAIAGILTFSDKVIDREYARKVKEELRMTKVEQLIFEEGMEAGIEKGVEQGIRVFIRNCKEFHVKREDTKQRMKEEFSLSEEKAEDCLNRYWN